MVSKVGLFLLVKITSWGLKHMVLNKINLIKLFFKNQEDIQCYCSDLQRGRGGGEGGGVFTRVTGLLKGAWRRRNMAIHVPVSA